MRSSTRARAEEEIEQIGAFRQFDRKKYEQQGLGLGLSLVQKLAARNRAQFAIERLPEQGIKVTVSFPYGPPQGP